MRIGLDRADSEVSGTVPNKVVTKSCSPSRSRKMFESRILHSTSKIPYALMDFIHFEHIERILWGKNKSMHE